MDDETRSFCGCLGLIAIALLIGVGLRSQNYIQFLVVGGAVVGGIVLLLIGFASFIADAEEWGWLSLIMGGVLAYYAGAFLITGNYEGPRNWGEVSPTSAALSQPQNTLAVTLTSTPQPTFTPIPIPTSTPQPILSNDLVTAELDNIWRLSTQDAKEQADFLRSPKETEFDKENRVSDLLIAVALERAGDLDSARSAYTDVVNKAENTPLGTSAAFRLHLLENPELSQDDKEELYEAMLSETEGDGWFLQSDQWVWSNTRQAASQALVNLRADQLSFRFFQYLRLRSPLSISYSYLFILLVLAAGAKILMMPLYIKSARATQKARQLQPDIQRIKILHSDDNITMNQELMNLYQQHGLDLTSGCMIAVADLIFVIWALVALNSYSPQLVLDGAKLQIALSDSILFMIPDVTRFNLSIVLVWLVVSFIQSLRSGIKQQSSQTASQLVWGNIISIAIIIGIAWYWKWPAYVFVFWVLLSLVGMLISSILRLFGGKRVTGY